MLMKADTNIAFGEEFVVLDDRYVPLFKPTAKTISADPQTVTIPAEGGSKDVTVTASGEYTVGVAPAGFKVVETETGVTISAEANDTGSAKSGTLTITLDSDASKTAKITISQAKQEA